MNDTVVSLKTIADMQNNNINFMLMHIKRGVPLDRESI